MDITLSQLIDALNSPNGLSVVFVFIIMTGFAGKWVFGRELARADQRIDELTAENKELREELYGWRMTGHDAKRLTQRTLGYLSERDSEHPSEAPW